MKRLAGCVLLALLAVPRLQAGSGEEADAVLHKTVDAVLALLDDKSLETAARRAKIIEVIDPVFDFQLMAKLTLGRKHWPQFSADQKKEFTDLFVKQLRQTYFEKVDQFSYDRVEYKPPVLVKKKVQITLDILSKDDKVTTLYKMYKKSGAWRIYDVEVNSVSIVSSYRSDYHEQLRQGSPADLIESLRKKVAAN